MKHKSRTCSETLHKLKKEKAVFQNLILKLQDCFRETFSINFFLSGVILDTPMFTARNANKLL